MSFGFGSPAVERVGEVIRDLLLKNKEMYGQELYREVKKRLKHKHSTYHSFQVNYLNKMAHLQLIIRTRKSTGPTGLQPRQYWRINPRMQNELDLFRDPQVAWKQKRLAEKINR